MVECEARGVKTCLCPANSIPLLRCGIRSFSRSFAKGDRFIQDSSGLPGFRIGMTLAVFYA